MTGDELDGLFEVLAGRHRRLVLRELRGESDAEHDVTALAAAIRAASLDDAMEHDRLCVALVHRHLPKLAAHGLVEYDGRQGTVVYSAGLNVSRFQTAMRRSAPTPTVYPW